MKKLVLFLTVAILFSCKKDPALVSATGSLSKNAATGQVQVRITNVCDSSVLQLMSDAAVTSTTTTYVNANADTFLVSKLKYYISNVRLKKADGTYYTENYSYHLIDASDTINKGSFVLTDVPADNYISVEFLLGVDSLKNIQGAQTGDLDPAYDMFWSWFQGYIFFKFEGYSNKAPASITHNLTFHVGGFSAPFNNITKFNLAFPSALPVDADHASTIYMKCNVLECFRNPNTIQFDTYNIATLPSAAKMLVADYADIFQVSAVKH